MASRERIVSVGGTARRAIVRCPAARGPGTPDAPPFLNRRGGLHARHPAGRPEAQDQGWDPGAVQPPFPSPYVRSELPRKQRRLLHPQRILGHMTLDILKRYMTLADVDLVTRHATAS
jgi:hypothetical protein